MSATTSAWLVLACPLAGMVLVGAGFRIWPGRVAGYVGTLAIAASFVFALITFLKLEDRPADQRQLTSSLWDYAKTTGLDAQLSILVDPLSVMMILVVTGVSTLIHLYSTAYLDADRGYSRFFAYLNYFVFSMLLLVLAGNFLLLIVGWAFVGAASYLLISFWYRRTTATRAGIKAFVINVVGDVGLVLGTFILLKDTGAVDFLAVFRRAPEVYGHNDGALVAACVLLLVGAFAKSAQIPLHTWLPDAMEGPTPVSALIHAATMVTAGVYLIARCHPLFLQAPTAGDVGAVVGLVTLLIAGTIALAQTDLKRVIAYSTMSQIGYMIMAVSAGAYWAGMFHLMTHAFFKALLFMAAGSIIGAMAGVQSLDRMSGFRKALPFTFACFVVGGLALAAFPPFSGFFSKDDLLGYLATEGGWRWILYVGGYLGAFLTAIYTFRMIFRAFWGEPCPEARELEDGHLRHAETPTNPADGSVEDTGVGFPGPEHVIAEREWAMKLAMGILAVLAAVAGIIQIPDVTDAISKFLDPAFADDARFDLAEPDWITILGYGLSILVAGGGIALAWWIWVKRPGTSARLIARFPAVHRLLVNKWYFDEAIDILVVRPALAVGRFSQQTFERVVVDGAIVGAPVGVVRASSAAVRAIQNGFVRSYVALLLLGLGGVALYFLVSSS